MKNTKPIETIEVDQETFYSDTFKPPTKLYFRNAHGNYVYLKIRKREDAQKWLDDNYGIGFYSIRTE